MALFFKALTMRQAGSMPFNKAVRIYIILSLAIFYILSVLIHLNYYPLNGDEPRRAMIAIEMEHSGNFIMPTTLGWEYYNKPPVYNWIISAFMFLTNSEGEIAVRLPSLVSLIFWSICNYKILKKIVPAEVAALSSFFLLTSFDIFFWGLNNGGEIDIFYSFIVYLQVISIFYFNQEKRWTQLYLASYTLCAIGLLTKGFPSILFEGLTLLALCVYNRSMRMLFKWQHLTGIAVFVLITGSYFYAYSFHSSPLRFLINLLKEAMDKSFIGDRPERLVRRILEYPFSLFKTLLPWSLLLLLIFKKRQFIFKTHPFFRFSLLFVLFNIPIYWFTGHSRMRYSYMFVPFFMTVFAFIFYEFKNAYPDIINRIFRGLNFAFVGVFGFIIVLPFLIKIDYIWYTIAIVAFGLFLYLNRKALVGAVWYFGVGIILCRFVYSSLYLPSWYESIRLNYKKEVSALAAKNNFAPVRFYTKPDTLDLSIDLKFAKFHYDSIPVLPYLVFEVPYYYYRNTGKIVKLDTILRINTNYIGLLSSLKGKQADILYSFDNRDGEKVVLFRAIKK
ncbi:MAG: glycosyltransferase family 39 protein [Chitinophagaceae bacterium]